MAGRKEGAGRCIWSTPETRCLISIWGQAEIQKKLEGPRTKMVYAKIHQLMKNAGYEDRTAEQIKRKIADLKAAFNKAVKKNKKSGEGRKLCHFYNELNVFLGGREALNPQSRLESIADPEPSDSEGGEDGDAQDQALDSPRGPSPPPEDVTEDSINVSVDSSSSGLNTSASSSASTSSEVPAKTSTQPEKRKADEEGGGVEKKGKTASQQKKGKPGFVKKAPQNKTRIENSFSALEKSFSSLQDEQEKRQREAEKQKMEEWKEHDLQVVRMQQEHETRTVNNMMGQFMTMMGQFMTVMQQGSTQFPPTYGGQSRSPSPMPYNPSPYPPIAGGQSWSSSMPRSAVPSGSQYASMHGGQSQGPSMSNPALSMPHTGSEDPSTSEETYFQL